MVCDLQAGAGLGPGLGNTWGSSICCRVEERSRERLWAVMEMTPALRGGNTWCHTRLILLRLRLKHSCRLLLHPQGWLWLHFCLRSAGRATPDCPGGLPESSPTPSKVQGPQRRRLVQPRPMVRGKHTMAQNRHLSGHGMCPSLSQTLQIPGLAAEAFKCIPQLLTNHKQSWPTERACGPQEDGGEEQTPTTGPASTHA